MSGDETLEPFARLIEALRPFLDRLVIVGGWAPRLYRYRPDALIPPYLPLFTRDADVAIPSNVVLPQSIREQLLANGFNEELRGEDRPPITYYHLGAESSGFYAEFLTPLIGGGGRPGKTSQDTVEVGGVVAQKLRYLDILMIEPWQVTPDELSLDGRTDITVPNAVCYIAQKLLIRKKRTPRDRAKDALYVHDTIELFGASLDELQELWQTIRPRLSGRIAADVDRLASDQGHAVIDALRDAVDVAAKAGRGLTFETIQAVYDEGLSRIFGRHD